MMSNKGIFRIAASILTTAVLGAQFRINSDLVLVPVTVTDRRGANITGLQKEHFTVFEDGRPQPIVTFYSEDAPCTVGLVMDTSRSMAHWIEREKNAIYAFLELSNPDDDYFVITSSSSPAVLALPGTDFRSIAERVRTVTAGGWTALFDAIRAATNQIRRSPRACRALIVISDGMDNHSRTTRNELMQLLMETDVQIYTIRIGETVPNRKGVPLAEYQRGVAFMTGLGENTGGLSIGVHDWDDPSGAARKVSVALRDRYVIGFRASNDRGSEKWHRIQVKIDRSKANVYARSGYRRPELTQ